MPSQLGARPDAAWADGGGRTKSDAALFKALAKVRVPLACVSRPVLPLHALMPAHVYPMRPQRPPNRSVLE